MIRRKKDKKKKEEQIVKISKGNEQEEQEKKKKFWKREAKKKKPRLPKTVLNLVPIRKYDTKVEAFTLENGKVMDILRVIPRDLVNISDEDLGAEIVNLIKIYKTIDVDLKFISMNFPLNTQYQRDSLFYYKTKVEDEVRQKWIDRQIEELNLSDSNILTREFYLVFFGDNKEQFIKNKETIQKFAGSGRIKLVSNLTQSEKIHVITNLNNMNTLEDLGVKLQLKEEIIEKKEMEIDVNLFSYIQPKGGVSFKEPSYMQFGDGYVRCLHLYELPTYINEFWLAPIINMPNCICVYDVSSKNISEVKKNINKSITEENSRAFAAKSYEELYDAEKRKEELQELYDSVSRLGEIIKTCDFRIYVTAKTYEELEERCNDIIKDLEADGFKVATLLNEQKNEWLSLYEPSKVSHAKPFTLNGLAMTSEQLATGFPFNYSELKDTYGVLLGHTKTGGVVLFDQFTKTEKRKHYNAVVCGDMGSGKSTHLKKMFKHNASIGNYIRTFDISGEFTNITKEFGGKIIRCKANEGMLNPLEILQAGDDDNTSYTNHIAKISSFFKCIIPSMDDNLRNILENQLQGLYATFDLTPRADKNITGLPPKEYPTLSHFKAYLESQMEIYEELDKQSETDIEKLQYQKAVENLIDLHNVVSNLVNNYGYLFDGISSIRDISREKIVTFDISDIKDLGAIFAAQMQILVSLCWDNAVTNGKVEKEKSDKNTSIPHEDITKFLVLIDESHRWVNTSMPQILDMLIRYMREARKYFAGIVLASQSIRDFIPSATTDDLDKIRMLFELSQYKVMFRQDSSALEHIEHIFGYSLTPSQIGNIPFLEMGELILSISGDKSLEFKEWLSEEYEKELFAGGK